LEVGRLTCWGQNGYTGPLGYGYESHVGDTESPAQAGYVNVGGDVEAVAPGFGHTCAILAGGAVRCWGNHLRIGIPGNEEDIGDDEEPTSIGNTNIGGPAREIIAGDSFSCALREDDEVLCWGGWTSGKLGYGTPDDNVGNDETPAEQGPVPLGGPVRFLSRGSGGREHSCAMLQSGEVRCWGDNGSGQLGLRHLEDVGDDETPDSEDPVLILD
jgi:alpha-tubulin suppressor-like RCC1 family protein